MTLATAANPDLVSTKTVPHSRHRLNRHAVLLLLIVVLAAAIRFFRISHPPLLIDECFTFWRVCGDYNGLVETLRGDGFVPLHYEFLWFIHHCGVFLTPLAMRFVPAVCGTLMPLVMYFLARQLFGKKTSFAAALLIAVSAYGLFFSRDAKMYMPTWFAATLSIGCLLWWLRTWKRVAWLAWIAAGVVAAGFHIITLLLLPLAPILFITSARATWMRSMLLALGIIVIVAGPVGYYGHFNQWTQRSGGIVPGAIGEPAPDANWHDSGLDWLGGMRIDNGISAPFQSLSTYLTGFEWNDDVPFVDNDAPWPTVGRYAFIAGCAMYGFLILGILPWPGKWRVRETTERPQPWHRSFLLLACWIVLPSYGFFYCRSVADFSTPGDWVQWAVDLVGSAWPWVALTMVALALAMWCWPVIRWIGGAVLVAAIVGTIVAYAAQWPVWFKHFNDASMMRLAIAVGLPSAFTFSAPTMRRRLINLAFCCAIVGFILATCAFAGWIWQRAYEQSMRDHPDLPWRNIWHTRYVAIVWPAVWLAAAAFLMRLPTRAVRYAAIAIVVALNLANGLARALIDTQPPFDAVMSDIWTGRPSTDTLTFVSLRMGMSDMLDNPYWRPIVAYYACQAARIETRPSGVRIGNSWPFEFGPRIEKFWDDSDYHDNADAQTIAASLKARPGVKRIVVWDQNPPEIEPQAITSWRPVSQKTYFAHWYWDWSPRGTFHRVEYVRME